MSGNLPGAAAMTPRQAYEAWRAAIPDVVCNVPGGAWEDLPVTVQAGFAAIATRQPRPAPGVTSETVARAAYHVMWAASGVDIRWEDLDPQDRHVWARIALAAIDAWGGQPQAAPGASRERTALQDITAAIGEHDEADVKYPAELLVSIERIAELALMAPEPQPALELRSLVAALRDIRDANPEAPAGGYVIERARIALDGPNAEQQPAPWLAAAVAALAMVRGVERDQLRELLDEIGVLAANAPEDGDSFAVLEEIAMRIASAGVPS